MKVSELIAVLKEMPQDLPVILSDRYALREFVNNDPGEVRQVYCDLSYAELFEDEWSWEDAKSFPVNGYRPQGPFPGNNCVCIY